MTRDSEGHSFLISHHELITFVSSGFDFASKIYGGELSGGLVLGPDTSLDQHSTLLLYSEAVLEEQESIRLGPPFPCRPT